MSTKIKRNFFSRRYLVLLVVIVFLFFLRGFPPKSIFVLNNSEILIINQRRSYYRNPLVGRLMENKAGVIVNKFARNFFQGLDVNYYFFANHPRERAGVTETKKLHWLFLLPFLIGVYILLKGKKIYIFVYFFFALTLTSLFSGIDRYLYLFFPFFTVVIASGFVRLLGILKNDKK